MLSAKGYIELHLSHNHPEDQTYEKHHQQQYEHIEFQPYESLDKYTDEV